MKKNALAIGMTVLLMMSNATVSLAEVQVNGNTVSEENHQGDIKNDNADSAVRVNDGDSFGVDGNIESEKEGVTVESGSVEVKGDIKAEKTAIKNESGEVTVEGNVTTNNGDYFASTIENGTDGKVSVTGNVTAKGEDSVHAVDNSGTLSIKGDVESTDRGVENKSGNLAIEGNVSAERRTVLVTGGSVEITGNVDAKKGTSLENRGGKVTVTGDVANEDDKYGTAVYNRNSKGSINITGNVSGGETGVENRGGTTTVKGDVRADSYGVQNDLGTLKIDGNVEVTDTRDGTAVNTIFGETEVNGNISGGAHGVRNYFAETTVNGDITTNSTSPKQFRAPDVSGVMNMTGEVTVNGNIKTSGGTDSILNVKHEVTPEDESGTIRYNTSGKVTINGNIQSADDTAVTTRRNAETVINGDVTASGAGLRAANTAKVTVNGDVTADGAGLVVELADTTKYPGPVFEADSKGGMILVDGTIRSNSGKGIVIESTGGHTDAELKEAMPEIVVYQLEGADKNAFAGYRETGETAGSGRTVSNQRADMLVSKIKYIIRKEDNEKASMSLDGTQKVENYDVAEADKSITINVRADEGYAVSGVNGGQAVARKNSDGSWTLTVPKGGGVTISLIVQTIAEAEKNGHTEAVVSSGGSSKAEYSRDWIPAKVKTDSGNAMTGAWLRDPETGTYTFRMNGQRIENRWAKIYLPAVDINAWFYFDENGRMLTGWQRIPNAEGQYRWYYLNPQKGALEGACYLNTVTPDGYKVNSAGEWVGE